MDNFEKKHLMLGIDIGSTTVSLNLADSLDGSVIKAITVKNDSKLQGESYESLYDTEKITEIVMEALSSLGSLMDDVACIGVTGQMHGVIYVDENGSAVSPLYSWMDRSGDVPLQELGGKSAAAYIKEVCNIPAATGWGLTTVFYHTIMGKCPCNAAALCSVPDYIVMKLTGVKRPIMHVSNAASFGLYDVAGGRFRFDLIEKLNIPQNFIPDVTDEYAVIGKYKDIPVCVSIGDNQAGFISTVSDIGNSVLANIGTGSQVSFGVSEPILREGMELRPLVKGKYILAGSALCGGRAFSVLEKFFRSTVSFVTGQEVSSAYGPIDKYLDSMLESSGDNFVCHSLNVETLFDGTREDPSLRGSIIGISVDNFTPEEMIKGFMFGMCDGLYEMYEKAGITNHTKLAASGNAVRKSRFLQKALEKTFGCPIMIPAATEEAAYGAAIFASVGAGIYNTLEEAQKIIRYIK